MKLQQMFISNLSQAVPLQGLVAMGLSLPTLKAHVN
jgi:hypothetical protein